MLTLRIVLILQNFVQSRFVHFLRRISFFRMILRSRFVNFLRQIVDKKRQKKLLSNYNVSPDYFSFDKMPYICSSYDPLQLIVHNHHIDNKIRLEYRWMYQDQHSNSGVVQDWNSSETALFHAFKPGLYSFQLLIREQQTKVFLLAKWVGQCNFIKPYNGYENFQFSELPQTMLLNDEMRLWGKNNNNHDLIEYQWMYKKGGGLWNIIESWSEKSNIIFKPTDHVNYSFQVLIRDKNTKSYIMRKKWRNEVIFK